MKEKNRKRKKSKKKKKKGKERGRKKEIESRKWISDNGSEGFAIVWVAW